MDLLQADAALSDTDAAPALPGEVVALLDASAVPSFLIGIEADGTTIRYANPALARLADRDLVGQDIRSLASSRGERPDWAPVLDANEGGPIELLGARGDGSTYWGALTVTAVRGAPYRLGQIVDVTRLIDVEGALALSQQREALGLLTNSVAHEFNNFLQILIGYIDGLKRRLGERQEPFIQRALTRSTEAAERAAVLTRQLLAHSRRIAPEVRPVDLGALVASAGDRLHRMLPDGVALDVRPAEGLPPALCNPTQVELALKHIVANAREALDARGRIEITTYAVSPGDQTLHRPGDGAVGIAISDTGHGMSPEMMARALAPFATSRESGRGAGLAIVHGLMKRQNGTISFESRPGAGTTVRLVFPAAA